MCSFNCLLIDGFVLLGMKVYTRYAILYGMASNYLSSVLSRNVMGYQSEMFLCQKIYPPV